MLVVALEFILNIAKLQAMQNMNFKKCLLIIEIFKIGWMYKNKKNIVTTQQKRLATNCTNFKENTPCYRKRPACGSYRTPQLYLLICCQNWLFMLFELCFAAFLNEFSNHSCLFSWKLFSIKVISFIYHKRDACGSGESVFNACRLKKIKIFATNFTNKT